MSRYTANPPLEFCALYSTCGYVNDAACPDCRSGEEFSSCYGMRNLVSWDSS